MLVPTGTWVEPGLQGERVNGCCGLQVAVVIMSAAVNCGTTWADEEIRALLAIWGERKVQEEPVRNKAVFQDISKRLQEQGYSRDWEQCRTKIKSLKKEMKDHKWRNREREKNMQVLCRA